MTMNETATSESNMVLCCASCGTAGGDDIKLMDCGGCDLVRYCSVACQENHRLEHEEECKKRAAELRDESLFKQSESSYLGECSICLLPMPLDPRKSRLMSCCSKSMCNGCHFANLKREVEGRLQHTCPFCRKAVPKTEEECDKQWKKRVEADDPVAMCRMGTESYNEGDYAAAFEYLTKAVALGDVLAHYQLSCLYDDGLGVDKDNKKVIHHLEEAAIGGDPKARHEIG